MLIKVLLLLLIGYIIYKAFVLKRRFDAVRNDFRSRFKETERQFGGEAEYAEADRRAKKRYSSTCGEYVDYEEVAADTRPEPQPKQDYDPGAKAHAGEELISDAEYEEI